MNTTTQKSSMFFVVGILAFFMGFLFDTDRMITMYFIFAQSTFNIWVALGLGLFLIGALIPLQKKLGL